MTSNNTCSVEGCNQPRYVSGKTIQPCCHEHMRERWRNYNRGQKAAHADRGG